MTALIHYYIYSAKMNLLSDLKELLLPRLCPVCGKLLMQGEDVVCAFCAIGLPRYRVVRLEDNLLLRMVWDRADVKRATTFLTYNPHSPYHRLVIDFKFHGMSDLARRLGYWAAMEAAKQGFWEEADALVPVPLTWWRRLRRGYNQAEMLARGMAEATGLPVVNLVRLTKSRQSQTRLSGEQRRKNAEDIYRAEVPDEWRGKGLVVVDDVMTTGSTIAACAKALNEADESAKVSIFPLAFAGDY